MNLGEKDRWLARDKDGNLYAYEEKPVKSEVDGTWFESVKHSSGGIIVPDIDNIFSFVRWEDEEPYNRGMFQIKESSNKDIQFLKDLQEELNTQNNDSQASPRFWVVRQKVKRITDSAFADGQLYIYSNGDQTEFETIDELRMFLEEIGYDEELIEFARESDDIYDVFEEILCNYNEDGYFSTYSYEDVYEIKDNTMFLTKQEAKDHIKANYYHYNDTVHTYAMTAWRAPKVEKLMKILHEFDWNSLEGN